MRVLLASVGALSAPWTWAAEEAKVQAAAPLHTSELSSQITQLVLALMVVIGLIFLFAWVVRRIQQQLPQTVGNKTIQLLATQPLGPRERLLLVQVGKEQVLLGLMPGNIKALHVMQEPVEVNAAEAGKGAFSLRLKHFMRQTEQPAAEPGAQDKES